MTPQNAGYYYAAYAILAVLYVGYVVSIWYRARKLGSRESGVGSRD